MRWAMLLLVGCAPSPELPAPEAVWLPLGATAAPLPGELEVAVAGGILGGSFDFTITGANAGDEVVVVRGASGLGPGPCIAALGGQCLDIAGPVRVHTTLWTDADGFGEAVTRAPSERDLLGVELCFQAAVQRGFAGTLSELSEPSCIVLDRDLDGDGVGDTIDPCPDDPEDACVVEEWIFGDYDGGPTVFDPTVHYDGDISCAETCGDFGLSPIGARWVCNHWDGGAGEGCSPANHGEWSDEWCTEQILDGLYVPGGNPACGNEDRLRDFLDGVGTDPYTWHAIECQCE